MVIFAEFIASGCKVTGLSLEIIIQMNIGPAGIGDCGLVYINFASILIAYIKFVAAVLDEVGRVRESTTEIIYEQVVYCCGL